MPRIPQVSNEPMSDLERMILLFNIPQVGSIFIVLVKDRIKVTVYWIYLYNLIDVQDDEQDDFRTFQKRKGYSTTESFNSFSRF